jgi:hypothetical protein
MLYCTVREETYTLQPSTALTMPRDHHGKHNHLEPTNNDASYAKLLMRQRDRRPGPI